jgi:hypothetical protein
LAARLIRALLIAVAAWALVLAAGCPGSSEKKTDKKKWRVEPSKKQPAKKPKKPKKPKKAKHAPHPHAHGSHPHGKDAHHHHPHPHPHLDGPNGHHHPY